MAVLKMQRITVCALKKDRKAILEKIQSMGVLQVDPVLEDDSDFKKTDTAGQRMGFEKAAASVTRHWIFWTNMCRRRSQSLLRLKGKR